MKIENYSKALAAEMEKDKKIQRDFLPSKIPCIEGWEIAACFYPARQVSGDFYDVFLLSENLVGLVIADVCDKGIGSALYMALFRSLIRVFPGHINLPGMPLINRKVQKRRSRDESQHFSLQAVSLTYHYIGAEHGEETMFATLFLSVLDPRSGKMAYINGGHEPPVILDHSGLKRRLKAAGPVVGILPDAKFEIKQVIIEPGDILIGYKDGVTEALSPAKEFFSRERFFKILENPAPTASKLMEQVQYELYHHMINEPQFDDVTMLAVHRESRLKGEQ